MACSVPCATLVAPPATEVHLIGWKQVGSGVFAQGQVVVGKGMPQPRRVGVVWSVSAPPPEPSLGEDPLNEILEPYLVPVFSVVVPGYESPGRQVWARLVAEDIVGRVSYSAVFSATAVLCLPQDTLVSIVLPDGVPCAKPIQDIWYDDLLLCWDFARSELACARPLWIKVEESVGTQQQGWPLQHELTLDNGATLRTVHGHRVFNADTGVFTVAHDAEATPIGTRLFTASGARPRVVHCRPVAHDPTLRYYNIITGQGHMNLFANTVLTSCRYSNARGAVNVHTMLRCEDVAVGSDDGGRGVDIPECLQPYARGLGIPHTAATDKDVMYLRSMWRTRARAVLFLDHQGVMRTAPNPTPGVLVDFDVEAVAALNAVLLAAPHVDIVVISDWRDWVPLAHMQAFYRQQGIVRGPVSYTPHLEWPLEGHANPQTVASHRAQEIMAWLGSPTDDAPRPIKWVVADDMNLAPWLPPAAFVHVRPAQGGLTAAHATRLQRML